jgi:hypothetical protein
MHAKEEEVILQAQSQKGGPPDRASLQIECAICFLLDNAPCLTFAFVFSEIA